jgi:hypothetical protein
MKISFEKYIDDLFRLRDKAFDEYKENNEKARVLAAAQVDTRLEKLNELRQEVVRDRGLYI